VADAERSLVSKAITERDMATVVSRGVDVEHFYDEECAEVWEFGLDFMAQHKDTPSPAIIRERFPDFKIVVSKDPLSYHTERFIKHVKEQKAIDAVRDFHDAIEDPDMVGDIELHALDMARMLAQIVPAPREHRFSDGTTRLEEYKRRKEAGDIWGILMGIPTIDNKMMGIQAHELVTIAAYMGVGKSTLMQYIAYSAYLQGKTSLIISLEMEADAILRKIDTMASNVRYSALKALDLEVGEQEQWQKILERAEEDKHERDIIVVDDIHNCTASHVMAKIASYKPDICFVDYLQLMHTPRHVGNPGWEKVNHSGVNLKQTARIEKVPIITAAQINRDGAKDKVTLSNIGHQSVGKHSDIVIGLSQDEEQESQHEMDVIALKVRDAPKGRCTMRWQLDTMDIREKDTTDRFPTRDRAKSNGTRRQKRDVQRFNVKRQTQGKENPWAKRSSVQSRSSTSQRTTSSNGSRSASRPTTRRP